MQVDPNAIPQERIMKPQTQPVPQQDSFFIVLEGLDGTGKTTAGKLLAQKLGGVFLTTPSPEIRKIRDRLLPHFHEVQEAHHLFYLSTVFAAVKRIREYRNQNISVVLDRYFLSTEVYATQRGSLISLESLADALPQPDFTFYFQLPNALRAERLHKRGTTAGDLESIETSFSMGIQQGYQNRKHLPISGQFRAFDITRDMTAHDVTMSMWREIQASLIQPSALQMK